MLLSISLSGVPDWTEQGPGPINAPVRVNDTGAINAIVVDPTDPSGNNIYIGSVNGGVWHTTNGKTPGQSPTWTPLTDFLPSLRGVGTLAISPQNHNILFAGTPGFTNGWPNSPTVGGVFRSTDAGVHWSSVGQGMLNGGRVNKIAASTLNQVVLVATDNGIYLSEDEGDSFTQVLSRRTTDLIEAHFGNQVEFFAGVPGGGNPGGGVYRSLDGGQTWIPVNNGINVDLIKTKNVKVAVHDNTNVVYSMVADDKGNDGQLTGVFRSTNGGGSWTPLGVPVPGLGADFNDCAFAADPIDRNLIYFGGYGRGSDFVGDASKDPNTRWTPLEYELEVLLMSWGNGSGVPTSGNNLVIVGIDSNGLLHIRIFDAAGVRTDTFETTDSSGALHLATADASGTVLSDKLESGLPPTHADAITNLKNQVPGLELPHVLTKAEKDQVRGEATLIADQNNPHQDHRIFVFDPKGDLLEGDDGGIYRLNNPRNLPPTRAWEPIVGDLRITEMYAIGYDDHDHVLFAGTQDNSTIAQPSNSSLHWSEIDFGDGGDQGVDNNSDPDRVYWYSITGSGGPGPIVRRTYGPRNSSETFDPQEPSETFPIEGAFYGFTLNETDPKRLLMLRDDKDLIEGFDLRLMSWGNGSGVPTSGKNLVVVGTDNNGLLHIRIFDTTGNPIKDMDETQLPNQAAAIATLKQRLPGLLPPHVLTDAEKKQVIAEATSIVGRQSLIESPDRGATLNNITGQLPVTGIDQVAYRDDVAYVGATDQTGAPAVFLRTTKDGSFVRLKYVPAGKVLSIALDPDEWRTAYLVDDGNSQVWQVVHAGLSNETWTNITGNLKEVYPLPINPHLFSIMMVKVGSTKVLLVGNQYGVYRTFNPQAGAPDALWTRYGNNLPFVQVRDMLYDAKDDVFAIGTFGRGAWTVANASATIATPWSPTATLTNGGPVNEGSTGLVRFTDPFDPSPVDTAAGFRYSYDFDNDGVFEIAASPSASAVVPASYLAVGPGIRTVRARIADQDGGYTDYTTTILINNVPPTVNVGPNATITQGGSLSRTGSFSDPGADTWTATVDYGDGTGSQTLTLNADKTFRLDHTYARAGTFPVTVVVMDGHGSMGLNSFMVVVAPLPVVPPPPVPQPRPSPTPIVGPVPITTFAGQFPQSTVGPVPMTSFTEQLPQVQIHNDFVKAGSRPLSVNRTVNLKRSSPLSPIRVRLGQRLAVAQPHPAGPHVYKLTDPGRPRSRPR